MATTKKKRRKTKHRGNAAGMVEARGRTSGPAAGPPAKGRRAARPNRFDEPPTWKGATLRAAIAAALFVALVIVAFGESVGSTLVLGAFVFLMYIPLGYYTDAAFHRRRQRKLGRS